MKRKSLWTVIFFAVVMLFGKVYAEKYNLIPWPASLEEQEGRFRLEKDFQVFITGIGGTRVEPAVDRFLWQLDGKTSLMLRKGGQTGELEAENTSGLQVVVRREGVLVPGEDEKYSLTINPKKIELESETDLGILYGLQTLLQLVEEDENGFYFPCLTIEDQPRFPWRGLLIDVCRHWMPMEVIKRNIEGMAAVKMNVLHLHLSEDQGFRVECKRFPYLHSMGSQGNYFTQIEIRELQEFANARGIRIVPEFDLPGHATSWFVGYPQLASAPGPYQVETKFGVFDPTFNPTQEQTYVFLDAFFAEMSGLFDEYYVHIGGDENNGHQWDANPQIQAWMKENRIKDNHELQAYFNKRLLKILTGKQRGMIGWDEILQPDLPKTVMIQSWRGRESLYSAAKQGYSGILSNGYYIDLCKPAAHHYLNDPLPVDAPLSEEEKKRVLGGEATMWAELVTPETIDSRIWPRTGAIAERLWSPANVTDIRDMYRRLDFLALHLEGLGLTHFKNREMMLRRHSGQRNIQPLMKFVDLVEPLKGYKRHHQGVAYSTALPFTRLPDIAVPDAPGGLKFRFAVEDFLENPGQNERLALESQFQDWQTGIEAVREMGKSSQNVRAFLPLAQSLEEALKISKEAINRIQNPQNDDKKWQKEAVSRLEALKKPVLESELAVLPWVQQLVEEVKK